jgi:outer membrane protein assembly factor BamD (BamD/ComL family)
MYGAGTVTVDEISEAEKLFTQRDGNPELRKLYTDLANSALPINYFRQLRQSVPQPQSATASAVPVTTVPLGPTPEELDAQRREKEREASAWEITRLSDSEKAYDNYLSNFPTGPHINEARQRKAEIQEIERRKQMETTAYILAQSQNSEEGWANFIKSYPSSQLAVLAQSSLDNVRKINSEKENAVYGTALQNNMPDDWDRYIKEYPRGRFVEEAMRKKTDAIRRIEEENTLKLARNNDTLDSWKNYADKYPNGNAVPDAKKRMEQLTWLTFADLKAVPAGSFLMGNLKGDGDEKPTHRVEVDAFKIGRTEVTNAQYLKFLEETRRAKPADPDFAKGYMGAHPDLPVVNVTYADALAYCQWLSQKTGATVRLPTEAEWEYAALAGHDGALYPWITGDPKSKARFNGNTSGSVKTVARDAFPPNDFGLFNVSGNVSEWVADYYSAEAYKAPSNKNPAGPAAGKERVVRGGSFKDGADDIRVSRRSHLEPNKFEDTVGFRVVVK